MALDTQLETLAGIGPARQRGLLKLGLGCLRDLLFSFPRDYEDRSVQPDIAPLDADTPLCFEAMIVEEFRSSHIRAGMDLTRGKIADHTAQVAVSFFNQPYVSKSLVYGERYRFYGKLTGEGARRQMVNPLFERLDTARLTGALVPIYPATAGISQKLLLDLHEMALPYVDEITEILPPEILQEHQLASSAFSYQNIHQPSSWEALRLARARLIFEELLCLSLGLALLRERRSEGSAPRCKALSLAPFWAALSFAPTAAQDRAVAEIVSDMQGTRPMSRLLQGDVGSGKTAVAAAAVYLAAQSGLQCALMAPTDLLARQHLKTMDALLTPLGLRVGLLTGALPAKQKRALRECVLSGEIDLLIGTHALLVDELHFQNLGLVITDEQHRFGVNQRAKLSAKAAAHLRAHVLVMSATPIPRTLALMIYGDLDLSVLDELPPGRTPVQTMRIGERKRQDLYGFVRAQVAAGRQVYLVCPTVEDGELADVKSAETHGAHLQAKVFSDLSVAILHGRMKAKEKERVMAAFSAGEIQVLVSTTVIEVGVDVPNASLMIIENAERFGLSQLHQLRGRVGRGAEKSYCVLISETKNEISRARLQVLCQSNDGFFLAEEDLRLRGPGDFFGARQHGLPQLQIADLAGDMRQLKQAQGAALALLDSDPDLSAPTHRALRDKVLRLFDEHRDSFS